MITYIFLISNCLSASGLSVIHWRHIFYYLSFRQFSVDPTSTSSPLTSSSSPISTQRSLIWRQWTTERRFTVPTSPTSTRPTASTDFKSDRTTSRPNGTRGASFGFSRTPSMTSWRINTLLQVRERDFGRNMWKIMLLILPKAQKV